jgi:hypothetical protein
MYDRDVPNYGDIMTREEWLDGVQCWFFTDYDGCGNPAKMVDGVLKMAGPTVRPSTAHLLPEDATHIVWYNK